MYTVNEVNDTEALHANQLSFINGGEGVPWAPEIPIWLSLLVILGTLGIATMASLIKSSRNGDRESARC